MDVTQGRRGCWRAIKTLCRSDASFLRFCFPISRRRVRDERMKQMLGGVSDVVHRAVERLFVRFRWLGEAAQLADELQRRSADFILGRGRKEVVKGLDVSAHNFFSVTRRPARVYPPAMAPMMKNGSLPLRIASGSGVSGDSRDKSSPQTKNRTIGLRFSVP
jgi:hypothetical protein